MTIELSTLALTIGAFSLVVVVSAALAALWP